MLKWNDPRKFLLAEASRIALELATDIDWAVVEETYKPKSGRPGKHRPASAPGETFATQSGHWVKHLEIAEERTQTRVTVWIGVKNTPYAQRLEFIRPTLAPVARRVFKDFRSRSRRRRR